MLHISPQTLSKSISICNLLLEFCNHSGVYFLCAEYIIIMSMHTLVCMDFMYGGGSCSRTCMYMYMYMYMYTNFYQLNAYIKCHNHHRTALETIEKLSHTLDFSDYASQIIHAIIQVHTTLQAADTHTCTHTLTDTCSCINNYVIYVCQVLDTSPELRPVAMETLICMVVQLGQRYKIFIPAVKKV